MTALAEVAAYLPETILTVEEAAAELGLTPMQAKLFRRFHGLSEVRRAPGETPASLLMAAAAQLTALPGHQQQVRYVLHARTMPVAVPFPHNPLHEVCRDLGLGHAVALTVTHHACATALLAVDIAGRLLAADGDPDALALVLAGEKTFTRDAQLVPETSLFSDAAAACLVQAAGPRDRLLAYASEIRGEFNGRMEDDPELMARYQQEYPDGLATAIRAAVAQAGLSLTEVSLVLPHNVNVVSWRRLSRRIGIPADRIVLDNVPVTGHAFCADAFLNYQTARQRGLLAPGDRYLIAAAGLGATFSAMVFEH